MKCILLGGSGEVGGAVARALIESDVCARLTLLGRSAVASLQDETKVDQVVVDTSAADFEEVVRKTAKGHDVAISCLGIGSGTNSMTEEQMMEIEVHLMRKYARGCKAVGIEIFELLSAVGVKEKRADSRIKALRVGGKKYKTVLEVGLFWSIVPGVGLFRNTHRVERMRTEHEKDPAAFVKSEKKRVDGFLSWYRPLLIGWTVLVFIGLALFHFWGGNLGRAIGLAVILCGAAGLMVDHTSEHNARAYHAEIERALGP